MREFFQGWRRKTGLALLAMALLLTAVWMRSFVIENRLNIQRPQSCHIVVSIEGRLEWFKYNESIFNTSITWFSWDAGHRSTTADHFVLADHANVTWRWRSGDFDFGSAVFDANKRRVDDALGQFDFWVIPYWSLVLPLTLFSAFLIFSKPRQPKSAKEPKRA